MSTIILDRDVLYREIWERPIREVAKSYALSDVGLAKTCTRLAVPTPPRGYWAKLESGQTPRIPALPKATGKIEETVDTHGRLYQWQQRGLDVRVSKAQVKRALRIMNALVRKLEELGFSVEMGRNGGREHASWVVIDGEEVQLNLRELSRMTRDPNPDRYGHRRRTYDKTGFPSGPELGKGNQKARSSGDPAA